MRRKDLGAYYTNAALCGFLTNRTLGPLLDRRLADVSKARTGAARERALARLLDLKICDPTVGEGAFLEAAFEHLVQRFSELQSLIRRRRPAALRSRRAWERHIRQCMLHGVDIDADAVALCRHSLGLSDRAIKCGNALLPAWRAEGVSPPSEAPAPREAVQLGGLTLSARQRLKAFCWQDEFPEVFQRENPGFDVILGNPPWNNLRPDDREFFATIDPEFRRLANRIERDRRKRALLRRAGVAADYKRYGAEFVAWNRLLREGTIYEHQVAPEGFPSYRIEHNLYKLALELAWRLTAPDGVIGLLVPMGFLGDLGATRLRKLYFEGGVCHGLWTFAERNDCFDAAQAFLALVFGKGTRPKPFAYQSAVAGIEELKGESDAPQLTLELLQRTAPGTYAVPELHGPYDLAILVKLHAHPPLSDQSPKHPWQARPARDLHTRDDRDLLSERDSGIPALKGDDIDAFALREPISRWVDPAGYEQRGKHAHATRVAWRAIANVNLTRRMCATLVPAGHALLNSLNYFIPEQDEAVKLYLVALLNSFVLEWRVRQLAKNNNINQYVIGSLPVPRLTAGDKRFDAIANLARHLLRANRMDHHVRVELEARIAHLYGLTKPEFAAVLERFPRVDAAFKWTILEYPVNQQKRVRARRPAPY